ncbi:FAD-binding domain-containing protein [Amylostereum chailletii]|nr:FAD-binding domain-containing protein [Amylostereum chailletii]
MMLVQTSFLLYWSVLTSASASPAYPQDSANTVCALIASAISSASEVFHPGSSQYTADIAHYSDASTQNSTCSVEPGTAQDVGIILQILGKERTPFAVKGGGHIMNPGFSSTTGVQVAMSRFSFIQNNPSSGTVDVGAGLIWDDVYQALDGSGINVVGGRIPGVGVAGLTLGGGYSWKTNQYGLALDNVAAYELVLPNGTVTSITNSSGDLWFALRGGSNNFASTPFKDGIVTKFTFLSHPQTDVWGGVIVFNGTQFDAISAAVSDFDLNVTDRKAQLIPSYDSADGSFLFGMTLFYDAPTPPPGIFDAFLTIPALSSDVSTRSFSAFMQSIPGQADGPRTVSILQYTPAFLQAVQNATQFWSARLAEVEATILFSINPEPFNTALYRFSPTSPSAYPPTRSIPLTPLDLTLTWNLPSSDAVMRSTLAQATAELRTAALRLGQAVEDDFEYGNYALEGTPVEKIYGANVGRLREIKKQYDPEDVMGLAGGFKL